MAQQNMDGTKAFSITEDVAWRRAVKIGASGVSLCAAGDPIFGITERDADYSDGDVVAVRLRSAPGTHIVTMAGACSVGDRLYTAANGKMSTTPIGRAQMVALEAATADNDEIEAVFLPEGEDLKQVTVKTADYTITKQECGAVFTNTGAAGAVTFTLPQDAPKGTYFHFVVTAAQELRIDPGAAGAIYINGAKQTDDKYISADDEAESVMLVADGNGDWIALHAVGTWSVEA